MFIIKSICSSFAAIVCPPGNKINENNVEKASWITFLTLFVVWWTTFLDRHIKFIIIVLFSFQFFMASVISGAIKKQLKLHINHTVLF